MPDSFASRLKRHPRYQQAIQRRMSVGPEVAAVPNTSDITQAYGSDMARTELAGTRHASAMDIGRERLDIGRESLDLSKEIHSSGMDLTHAKQDVARSQGRVATGIGIANLGLQGLAGVMKIQDANKQTAAMDTMVEELRVAASLPGAGAETIKLYDQARLLKILKQPGG